MACEINEIWKDIKGYEGLYQISNLGNVKSLEKIRKFGLNGSRTGCKKERILKSSVDIVGYKAATLLKDRKATAIRLHRLIAQEFIPNPDNKKCVNHKNGIKTDNRVENLEWCTHGENNKHAFNSGLQMVGEKHGQSKLTEQDVISIFHQKGSQKSISKIYGVNQSTVHDIKKGKTWGHLPKYI